MKVLPSDQVQLQPQRWVWLHYRKPLQSGTQEGRTYRGEVAEQDEAAAADDDDAAAAVVAAGQRPVGTGAAVREGRQGEKAEGNEGRTFEFMVHNDGNEVMRTLETSFGSEKLGTRWRGGMKERKSNDK